MSNRIGYAYDDHLREHEKNVRKAWEWIAHHFPDIRNKIGMTYPFEGHDASAWDKEEYDVKSRLFNCEDISPEDIEEYLKSQLIHYNRNPHHWQYWILHESDGSMRALDMPYHYIVEMVCDWWSQSFRNHDLGEIFEQYAVNKGNIELSASTRKQVEALLNRIRAEIE